MASTEFSNSPQVTQFTAAELGANSWRPGNAGRGRKKCSGRPQVSCLARVGQAASVQAWEKRGIGLERRQPPGRPSWEPLRFCRPPARPPARFSLSRKPARAETATHPQVGADQECGSWPKGLGCPLSPESRTPSIRVHHVEKGVGGSTLGPSQAGKPGMGSGWRLGYSAGLVPRGGLLVPSSPAQGHGLWAWPHSLLRSALRAPQGGWELRPLSSQCCVYKK